MPSPSSSSSSSSQLAHRIGGNGKVNWRLLFLTCFLSLATVTGLLFFNPGGIVPRGFLPAPPKGGKTKKKKGSEGVEGGEGAGGGPTQAEVPVEKGEDEREYEALGAKVRGSGCVGGKN